MDKIITINGQELKATANAKTPRLYRAIFGKDVVQSMAKYRQAYQKDPETIDNSFIENLAWLMLKQGGSDVGENVDEWLDSIDDPTAVYMAANDIVALWESNQKTTSIAKKK